MEIIKFGGKSLINGSGIEAFLNIIQEKVDQKTPIVVVVSARANATNELEKILDYAKRDKDYKSLFKAFVAYQKAPLQGVDYAESIELLEKIFEGVNLLGDYSPKIKDLVLAQGELMSAKLLGALLKEKQFNVVVKDSRELFKTDDSFGDASLIEDLSRSLTHSFFERLNQDELPIITGYIASNRKGETTTLGRNGSNYSAALIANFIDAGLLVTYTHVDGIFTADPQLVPSAKKIENLSYKDANELANFGAHILNAKAMIPLVEKNIPLKIINAFQPDEKGTLVSAEHQNKEGITAISVLKNRALINLEGKGLLGKVGIDARVFQALSKEKVSVSIISQGSSERGISFVVEASQAEKARTALANEFNLDFLSKDVNKIEIKKEVSVVSIIGKTLGSFHSAYGALVRNNIEPILINNTVTGRNVCLVVAEKDLTKAVHVIHGEVFGVAKKMNIAVFGVGLVGGTLIDQILANKEQILKRKGLELSLVAVANSKQLLLDENGIGSDWQERLQDVERSYSIDDVTAFAQIHHLENLIAVDNTASESFVNHYPTLVQNGFNLVSSNKIANTISFDFYRELRHLLKINRKKYLYETNVGAGLPLIDTLRLLHESGENITRIKGVFSGSLSYIFNTFSSEKVAFSEVLKEAVDKGFTEPDPREDLSGNDVARKLLILARELDLANEIEDVQIQSLIPETLKEVSLTSFFESLDVMDAHFEPLKEGLNNNQVLRYTGDLHGDLSQNKGLLKVSLEVVDKESTLGQLKGSDSIFEIYTESYGENPVIIQGAGAGAAVTARGVFGDILRLSENGL